ncbi:hypothetical protein FHS68_004174 [Dyadobacter arcticus]|uniref:Uncharacterized protein n=1 Tax=Dyadobacter arcticus TaxID=1078754 RepID=A0ABX0UQ72_9BACT|nr:hypothetical protein [Dyadobacter arcticus]
MTVSATQPFELPVFCYHFTFRPVFFIFVQIKRFADWENLKSALSITHLRINVFADFKS